MKKKGGGLGNQHIINGNRVTLLKDGREAFPSMISAIEGASSTINLETYMLRSDNTGWRFGEILAKKSSEGVEVNIIYDSLGSLDCGEDFLQFLQSRGINILEYNPIAPWKKGWRWLKRNHRKILVVDGRIGFTGGINIADDYADPSEGGKGWRDTHIKIEGPAVRELQRLFLSTWKKSAGEKKYFPYLGEAGDTPVQIVGSRERRNRKGIKKAYIRAIKNSKEGIYLTNAYFVPDRGILRAIRNACKRGVEIVLILPGVSDVKVVQYASRSLYSRLLSQGVKIYEREGKVLHSKTAVIDGIWSTIGSYNMDHRSYLYDLEVNAIIYGREFGEKVKRVFIDDLKDCRKIELDKWKERQLKEKLIEKFCFRFRHWM
ncbi:MAG: cardiolipin synthase [Nitrospinae bacterium RIFCSPLOWO2_01_FULL_39_10]|nr:MAG: cardiolipin synthase [Nitrospinae bacterium RIFCSPLOWO2_01_FULL_39_10]